MNKNWKYCFQLATAMMFLFCLGNAALAQTPLWKTMPVPPPLPAADTSGLMPVNGIKMYYAVYNSTGSDPVMLIHGGLGSAEDFGFEAPLLQKTNKVIVVDCRGRGRSTLGNQPLSYALMTSDIIALMDSLRLEKVSVVGESDGGIIGLLMGIHYPGRLDKLFAFGANFSHAGDKETIPDTSLFHHYLAMVRSRYEKISPTPDGFDAMLVTLRKMYAREPEISPDSIKKIMAPTAIADGEYEQFIKRAHTEELANLIPHASLLIIPNLSHGGPSQDPVAFHNAIMQLLMIGCNRETPIFLF